MRKPPKVTQLVQGQERDQAYLNSKPRSSPLNTLPERLPDLRGLWEESASPQSCKVLEDSSRFLFSLDSPRLVRILGVRVGGGGTMELEFQLS